METEAQRGQVMYQCHTATSGRARTWTHSLASESPPDPYLQQPWGCCESEHRGDSGGGLRTLALTHYWKSYLEKPWNHKGREVGGCSSCRVGGCLCSSSKHVPPPGFFPWSTPLENLLCHFLSLIFSTCFLSIPSSQGRKCAQIFLIFKRK